MQLPPPITLRMAMLADVPLLFALYSSTRTAELAAWGWDAPQQTAFLTMQFAAQQRHYATLAPDSHQIIQQNSVPIGRLIVVPEPDALLLADIALLPEARGQGIGTALITALQRDAAAAQLPLRLHVARGNRAERLYRRLGFVGEHTDGVYVTLAWSAFITASASGRFS